MEITRCSYYLPQLVGLNRFIDNYCNCYIGDIVNDEENVLDRIYIRMYQPDISLETNKNFLNKVTLEDNTIMYSFKVEEQFKDDFELFKDGKYSKLSRNTKDLMIKGYGKKLDEENIPYGVLTKQPSRKYFMEELLGVEFDDDMELMSILNYKREVYE